MFDDDEGDFNPDDFKIKVNNDYAKRYETWREKEELQKLKDKYGDDAGDSETSESEDEDAKELTDNVEKNFFKTLSLIKSRSKKIYEDPRKDYFESNSSPDENGDAKKKEKSSKKAKPLTLKDLEREQILSKLEKNDVDAGESEEEEEPEQVAKKKGYFEEQNAIKESFKKVVKDSSDDEEDDDDDGFIKVKSKSQEAKEKEEADYREWLKGQKKSLGDKELEKDMKYLHDYWNDPSLSAEDKFLRDYLLNKRYLDNQESDDESASEVEFVKEPEAKKSEGPAAQVDLDPVDLSEEEEILENQEEFERKYNFRFEEPDPEFIKSYPRTIADSMRRDQNKRKEKREEYKLRKEQEKNAKKEELKRLKNLKRKEIMSKIEKIKKITGNESISLNVDDLEKDFDAEEYERKMQEIFNDDYYQQEEGKDGDDDEGKPVFSDDDLIDDIPDYDEFPIATAKKEKKKKNKKRKKDEEDDEEKEDEVVYGEDDEDEVDEKRKKSKFARAILKKKPLFDSNEKSFEEYFDEYYKLDCEDVIGGDLPCRFKYREVLPNDFGLDVEEILGSKDSELNQWAPLKKVIAYRPVKDEIFDAKLYRSKKDSVDLKKKVLASVFNAESDEEDEDEQVEAKEEKTESQVVKKEKKETKDAKKESKETNGSSAKASTNGTASKKSNETSKAVEKSVEEDGEKKKKKDKKAKKHSKHKDRVDNLPDARLEAYGINPKRFKKKQIYAGKPTN